MNPHFQLILAVIQIKIGSVNNFPKHFTAINTERDLKSDSLFRM